MFTIRKARIDDCGLINQMAGEVFPATYQEILSPGQLDYMMDWMYSPENIRKQMEEEGHVYFIAYEGDEPCGYVSVQQQEENVFHLQKIYVLPHFQGAHCGSFLFREAVRYIKEVHPEPCLMELNVNRNNKALLFYERMGMRKLREGDFPIGNGYYMNAYTKCPGTDCYSINVPGHSFIYYQAGLFRYAFQPFQHEDHGKH